MGRSYPAGMNCRDKKSRSGVVEDYGVSFSYLPEPLLSEWKKKKGSSSQGAYNNNNKSKVSGVESYSPACT
jgi:hypothetical protein